MNSSAPGESLDVHPGAWTDRFLPETRTYAVQPKLLDIHTLRGFLWRQRFVLSGVTLLAIVAGLVITLLTTPKYEATSSVRIDPEQADIFQGEGLAPQISVNQLDSYLATLVDVLKSHSMAVQVAKNLKMDTRQDIPDLAEISRPAGMSDRQWQAERLEIGAEILQGGMTAEAPGVQRLINISYRSDDPAWSAEVANAYATNFLTDDLRRSLQQNAYAQNYLQGQIAETRTKLAQAERDALAYARSNGIVSEALLADSSSSTDTPSAAPQTVAAGNLASVNSTYIEARARRIAAEQRWAAVSGKAPSEIPEVQTNTTVQSLTSRRAELMGNLADLRTRYGDNHPEVRETQAEISSLDRQIGQISREIKNSLRNDFDIAKRQEGALSGELSRVSGRALDEQERRVAFNQLNGTVQALQTQLQSLLDRYNQISAAANVKPGTITLLDAARVPNGPVSPNLIRNLLVAAVFGVALAALLAILRETFDDRLRSAEDVETKLGVPMLGLTPRVDVDDMGNDSRALSESYGSIRAALGFALPMKSHNVVLLTSSQSSEGKTTTAVALARKFAQLGQRVLLVDGDLRRPALTRQFGLKRTDRGMTELLAGEITLSDAVVRPAGEAIDILPVGKIPSNPVEVISSPRVDEFFARMSKEYDLVMIDSPPVMGIADAPLLSRVSDGVVFIVESNLAHYGAAKTAIRRLRDADANVLGAVLTKFQALEAGQSYDYNYSYYTYGEDSKG